MYSGFVILPRFFALVLVTTNIIPRFSLLILCQFTPQILLGVWKKYDEVELYYGRL